MKKSLTQTVEKNKAQKNLQANKKLSGFFTKA